MSIRPGRGLAPLIALLAALPGASSVGAREVEARPLAEFPREQVVIETRSARRLVFDTWRADTDETRAQGLMFVTDMAESQAMIFVYETPQHVAMWMKNTYIPLDMVFADQYGCIVNIKQNAKPFSLDTIDSGGPVTYVLEVKAGIAKARAISVGDRLVRSGDENLAATQMRCAH
jgi:uncharacterized membrane protein (UPF0127 family)